MKYTVVVFLVLVFFINVYAQEKKIEFEFSLGAARVNPVSVYTRSSGIDALIDRYARYYQINYSFTGEFSESKMFIPFNISGNYFINGKLFLKAGIDYSFNKTSSEKTFALAWQDFDENHEYHLTNKISLLMPHFGVGYRYKSFDFYGALGLGFARFTHTEELNYYEPGYGIESNDTFKVKGTAPGIIIGFKYRVKINKKNTGKPINAFFKFETLLLKVGSLKGSKESVAADSLGESYSQTLEGTLYGFQWSPYGAQRFDFWDIYETPSSDPAIQNIKKLGINLSGIRFMIGISF